MSSDSSSDLRFANTTARLSFETTPTTDLLHQLKNRSSDGWAELLSRAESQLRVLLHFRMGEPLRRICEPEDLLQEVWEIAAANLHKFQYQGVGSLQRWLSGILSNRLRNLSRKQARIPVAESDAGASQRDAAAASFPALLEAFSRTSPAVSQNARQRELETQVNKVLEELRREYREVILLKIYEGLTSREGALRLGIDESTFSKRLKRALHSCAYKLRED